MSEKFHFYSHNLNKFEQKLKSMGKYNNINSFEELIELEHGKIGSETRNKFEEEAQMFIVGEMLKEARKEAKLTQKQLADKAGTKKSYISKLESTLINQKVPN